ncbi:C45 family autoproteolytic acyltransferase/hydolase [Acanthopleuribacter pedis]|uniref:Peptidase C45 hydrolase domain-containing protein n=1 Tax=Acanthopleuribacter pedis TaxID=442870 RepID=A0A8J7QJT4_9BACT|nr:C45 family peptidase [Acanthopleuribacter pedis]MBO1319510.1 hypothetical protein [Acanthopleuribacter pedis]
MDVRFWCVNEQQPGPRYREHLVRQWPRYADWYFAEAQGVRPPATICQQAVARDMPELVPWLNRLQAFLPEQHEKLTAFLSLYRPPAFLTGCSQVALGPRGAPEHGTHLIRNYDYSPDRFEATVMRTHWLQPVLCVTDCIWGALDGINGAGLAVSLAFGGGDQVDDGFGIPVVVRYLLETCHNVAEAVAATARLPSHMNYNLTFADTTGATQTLYVGAGSRPPRRAPRPLATNHQDGLHRRPYHQAVASYEREMFLANRLRDPRERAADMTRHFLGPPLYHRRYREGFGTLYTAAYHCEAGSLTLHWPGGNKTLSVEGIDNETFTIRLDPL